MIKYFRSMPRRVDVLVCEGRASFIKAAESDV